MKLKMHICICAAVMVICSGCGSVGSDPTLITKKNGGDESSSQGSLEEVTSGEEENSSKDLESSSEMNDSQGEQKEEDANVKKAQEILEGMSNKEKIGQLFIISPDCLEPDFTDEMVNSDEYGGVTWLDDEMKKMLEEYPVGGIIFTQKNLTDQTQLKDFIKDFQNESEISLFIAAEEEGESKSIFADLSGFDVDVPKDQAYAKDEKQAEKMGEQIGSYLKEYGFNLNLAPSADVNSNADNIIMGDRAFSSDAKTVGKLVEAEIDGLHKGGVMSAVKHFPGLGDVDGGRQWGVSTDKTWEQLKECEMVPFMSATEADMVVVTHVTAPNVTDDGLAASMSKEMITGKLRGELGWDGVVITDSMALGAVSNNYDSAECAVEAINAGADIILTPYSFEEAFEGVEQAVKDGSISEERLNESVMRILTLKSEYGLIE